MKLMATLRSGAGVPVGLRATGNPGGPGHQWVRQRYIDPAPLGNRIIRDPLTGLERVFIPSRVDNNQHIDVEAYKQRLRASGSQELVRAWLDGDWSVTMGAFFDCFSVERHVIPPFAIPADWLRFRSMDWGSASPFSVGWWAIVQDDHALANGGIVLPRGCMVRYREWYGLRPGEPNVGLKLHAEEVGKGMPRASRARASPTVCLIRPRSRKTAARPLPSASPLVRAARCGSGMPTTPAFRRAVPWAAGIRCAPAWWATAKGDR
jgi:hypothetical protein